MSKDQTKDEFKARVRGWAQRLEVEVGTISLRAMKRKWASYTRASGLLIFNKELLELDRDLSNYVVVHELLHYRAPNHGKLWKSLMSTHLGDYQALEQRLRKCGKPFTTEPSVMQWQLKEVVKGKALRPYLVWLRFRDGTEKIVDMWPLIETGEPFEPLRTVEGMWKQMRIYCATVRWEWDYGPGYGSGIDFAPEALYKLPAFTGPIEEADSST